MEDGLDGRADRKGEVEDLLVAFEELSRGKAIRLDRSLGGLRRGRGGFLLTADEQNQEPGGDDKSRGHSRMAAHDSMLEAILGGAKFRDSKLVWKFRFERLVVVLVVWNVSCI